MDMEQDMFFQVSCLPLQLQKIKVLYIYSSVWIQIDFFSFAVLYTTTIQRVTVERPIDALAVLSTTSTSSIAVVERPIDVLPLPVLSTKNCLLLLQK